MKIREIVKRLLKEDQEWFEYVVNEYDESSPDFILKLIQNELKNKTTSLKLDYSVYKTKDGRYCISEIDEYDDLSHFMCLDEDVFTVEKIKERIKSNLDGYSSVHFEYLKLYNDLKDLFKWGEWEELD